MFTARAEYRLLLRSDNCDLRLTEKGYQVGAVGEERISKVREKKEMIERGMKLLKQEWNLIPEEWNRFGQKLAAEQLQNQSTIEPLITADDDDSIPPATTSTGSPLLSSPSPSPSTLLYVRLDGRRRSAAEILTHSNMSLSRLQLLVGSSKFNALSLPPSIWSYLETECQYAAELTKQQMEIGELRRESNLQLPHGINFKELPSLSNEERDKLSFHKPTTIGEAARIQGITPSALMVLMALVKKKNKEGEFVAKSEQHAQARKDKMRLREAVETAAAAAATAASLATSEAGKPSTASS